MSPSAGPLSGGTLITMEGLFASHSDNTAGLTVRIGGVDCRKVSENNEK